MQATSGGRHRAESIATTIGLALLGLLVVLALLDETPGRGDAGDLSVNTPAGTAIEQDRADFTARRRADGGAVRPSLHRPTDRPWRPTDQSRPVSMGDRQEQIERLRRD